MFKNSTFFLIGLLCALLSPNYWQLIALLIVAVAGVLLTRRRKSLYFIPWITFGIAWGVLSIAVWLFFTSELVPKPHKAQLAGYVCSIPTKRSTPSHLHIQFDFCIVTARNLDAQSQQLTRFQTAKKVRASWRQYKKPYAQLDAGQAVQLIAKLKPIHGKANPAAFNFERWLVSQSYLGSISVRSMTRSVAEYSIQQSYHRLRQSLFNKLYERIPYSVNKGLVLAMVMGERHMITDQQWQAFQQSGTSHLLAISGLHVGIAAMWSYWLVLFLWKRSSYLCQIYPAPKAAEFAAFFGALTLTLTSACGIPALRALIMLVSYLVIKNSGRHFTLFNIIGIALLIILLTMPFAVLSASFWLSFSAVVLIALVVSRQLKECLKITAWFRVNFFLYLLMLPVGWLVFEQVSFVALIANLLLIPIYSFVITPLIYLACLFSYIHFDVATILFSISQFLIQLGVDLQLLLSQANQLIAQRFVKAEVLIWFCILFGLLLLPRQLLTKSLNYTLVMLLAIAVFFNREDEALKYSNNFKMWVFDVGHGLAVLIQVGEKTLLYDTAWGNSEYAVADSNIIPYLTSIKVNNVDRLVISHADKDHSGGYERLVQQLSFSRVTTGAPLLSVAGTNPFAKGSSQGSGNVSRVNQSLQKRTKTQWNSCHSELPWRWGDAEFSFINHLPKNTTKLSSNNRSCVLKVAFKGHSVLVTGDIEKAAEKRLVKKFSMPVDVLVAPHHGSKTSSTLAFVNTYQPEHVIFSSGYANQWHFPRKEVVSRYLAVGSEVWRTSQQGAVLLNISNKGKLEVIAFRNISPWFWEKGFSH